MASVVKRLLALPLFFALGGCFLHAGPTSVTGSECKVFERPEYAVLGKTHYDQDVVDNFVEGGVGACKWKRPAARPTELDAPSTVSAKVVLPVKKKKRGLLAKIWPAKTVAPVVNVPEAPAPAPAESAPAPCRPIDELLRNCGK